MGQITEGEISEDHIRSPLKKRILAQSQGGTEFQLAGILKSMSRTLNEGPTQRLVRLRWVGTKDFFEIASSTILQDSYNIAEKYLKLHRKLGILWTLSS